MAANEHKNLSDINRHNPKGLETAVNDSILTKNTGSGEGLSDGNLQWVSKKAIKVGIVELKGYTTGNGSTYEYAQNLTDGQAPFEHAADYTNGTVGSATLDVQKVFRAGGFLVQSNCDVMKIKGWMTCNGSDDAVLAVCKVTPSEDDATALTPVLIKEFTITSNGHDNMFGIEESVTFDNKDLVAGDIVFTMIKTLSSGKICYFNATMELGYKN
jgi:hypothetical protein